MRVEALEDRSTPTLITVINLDGAGAGSLREAIFTANGQAGADDIVFQAGLNGTITLGAALPDITESLTITGLGSGNTTIERSSAEGTLKFRIFTIQGQKMVNNIPVPVNVTLKDMTIKNGQQDDNVPNDFFAKMGGGIVHTNSIVAQTTLPKLTLDGVRIENCKAGEDGGAIYTMNKLELKNCTLSNNHAHGNGGALSVHSTDTKLENCLIKDNTCTGDGGGIYAEPGYGAVQGLRTGNLTMLDVDVLHNKADGDGGGLCIFINDRFADLSGVQHDRYTATISGTSKIKTNEALETGGAVWSNANTTLSGTVIEGNKGRSNGYVIYNAAEYRTANDQELMKLINCQVKQNTFVPPTPQPGTVNVNVGDMAAIATRGGPNANTNAGYTIEFTTTSVTGNDGHGVGGFALGSKGCVLSHGGNFIDNSITTSVGWLDLYDTVN